MMKTTIRRALTAALLLLLLTSVCLLCACTGGRAGDEGTDAPTEAVTDPAAPADTDPETAPTEEDTTVTDTERTETTPETTPAEVFAPDPARAVPTYDTLITSLDTFPLTFTYDGRDYSGFAGFTVESSVSEEKDNGVATTIRLRCPDIPLLFRLVSCVYPAEGAYEYTVYIDNDGDADSAVLSGLCFELTFTGEHPTLSGITGDAGGCYTPYTKDLTKTRTVNDVSTNGRPTHGVFPYYNLSYGDGGTFIAIGWPGTWKANFKGGKTAVTLTAGQYRVSTYIKPGETLRTPLMAFVEYHDLTPDEQTNAWRHYFINDVMRTIDGELPRTAIGAWTMAQGSTTNKILMTLKSYYAHGVPMETFWLDAGWYTGASGEAVSWPQTGTLDMDMNRFPDGMASIGQFAREHDMRFLLWFEPENVRLDKAAFLAGQPDFKEEWLLDATAVGTWLEGYLMNLGDPGCREWIFNKICNIIDTAGVNVFRQDFNNDPASAWSAADTKDRTGMTENQYVQGYLALWDAIIERYPSVMIDSCASGGGRNDLETMKRAVPLHYSDWFDGNPEDYDMKTRMTQTLFAWFPYFKNQSNELTPYKMRVNYSAWSHITVSSPIAKDANWDLVRQAYAEYDQVRGYLYADYYQLFDYTTDKNRWNGWEFYDPASASGYASVCCQADSTETTRTVVLKCLDPGKTYTVTDLDGLVSMTATGRALCTDGLSVTVPEQPYCVILLIKGQ